jgi:RsiW-degrading membrane proteinase PrsW (M82 family)
MPADMIPPVQMTLGIVFLFLVFSLSEEIAKFAACRTVLWKNPVLDEPVDAMIYMISSALGFAAIENVLFLTAINSERLLTEGVLIILLRMIGANFLHTLASGILGFFWAMSMVSSKKSAKIAYFGAGLSAATALHGAFNLAILAMGMHYFFPVTLALFIIGLIVLSKFDILKKLRRPIQQ